MIKYYIRTTGERTLDESISRELGDDYTLLVDTEHKPVKYFIEVLKTINNYDSILLEDDVILCKDFKNRIEEAVKKYPNQMINFFNAPELYTKVLTNGNFCYMQCRYYPKGSCDLLINELERFKDKPKVCPCLNIISNKHNLKILQYRPCLVQHLDKDSLVGNSCGRRRTPYFIDYLDELNIDYSEAGAQDNRKKLINLMYNKLKEGEK